MKYRQNGFIDIVLVLILAVFIVGGAALYFLLKDDGDAQIQTTAQDTSSESQASDETSAPTEDDRLAEQAALVAAVGYEGSGTAFRTVEGDYVHQIIAQLDDSAEGKFYEGWLVGPNVTSIGKLQKEAEGEWSLVFSSSKDFSSHDSIVVTEETEANGLDGNAETHVLEGSF